MFVIVLHNIKVLYLCQIFILKVLKDLNIYHIYFHFFLVFFSNTIIVFYISFILCLLCWSMNVQIFPILLLANPINLNLNYP